MKQVLLGEEGEEVWELEEVEEMVEEDSDDESDDDTDDIYDEEEDEEEAEVSCFCYGRRRGGGGLREEGNWVDWREELKREMRGEEWEKIFLFLFYFISFISFYLFYFFDESRLGEGREF